MKIKLLFIFLVFSTVLSAQTYRNTYVNIPISKDGTLEKSNLNSIKPPDSTVSMFSGSILDPRNQWNETSNGAFSGTKITFKYAFATDSVLKNNKWYKELKLSNTDTDNWERKGNFFRKEGQQIYYLQDGEDYLLYDFSLTIGDTFHLPAFRHSPIDRELIVTKVDSVTLQDNSERKRIYLSCDTSSGTDQDVVVWVEGIGGLSGFLTHYRACKKLNQNYLTCFHFDGTLLYQNPDVDKCWIYVSTKDPEELGLNLFPNPSSSIINIQGLEEAVDYKIYSITGHLLQSGTTIGTIDIKNLVTGIHILILRIDGYDVRMKLLKE